MLIDFGLRIPIFAGPAQSHGVLKNQLQHLLLLGAAMAKIYKHLTTQERAIVMTMRADLCPPDPLLNAFVVRPAP